MKDREKDKRTKEIDDRIRNTERDRDRIQDREKKITDKKETIWGSG